MGGEGGFHPSPHSESKKVFLLIFVAYQVPIPQKRIRAMRQNICFLIYAQQKINWIVFIFRTRCQYSFFCAFVNTWSVLRGKLLVSINFFELPTKNGKNDTHYFYIYSTIYIIATIKIASYNSRLKPEASGERSGLQIRSRSPSSLVCASNDSSFTGGESDVHAGLDESVRNDSLPLNKIPCEL